VNNITLEKEELFIYIKFIVSDVIDPKEQFDILNRSFKRLLRRKWWKKKVSGGVYYYGVNTDSDGNYLILLNVITQSLYLPFETFSEIWTEYGTSKIADFHSIDDPSDIINITELTANRDEPLRDKFSVSELLEGKIQYQTFGEWQTIS
jgi:hypothetical protein